MYYQVTRLPVIIAVVYNQPSDFLFLFLFLRKAMTARCMKVLVSKCELFLLPVDPEGFNSDMNG